MIRALPLALALALAPACDDGSDDTSADGAADGGSADGGSASDGGGGAEEDVTGESLYVDHCVECHGETGRGTTSGPDLSFEVQNHTDEQIIAVILNGKHDMPAVDVSEDEAQMIVDYLRGLFDG